MFYESVRFIQIFEQNSSRSKGTVFTKVKIVLLHLSFNKCYFDNKTIRFGHRSWKWTYKNELVLHLSLTKSKFTVGLASLAKE